MKEEITIDEVRKIMRRDHDHSIKTDWPWDNSNLPSKVDTLSYMPRRDKEIGYIRMILHIRTGTYVLRDDLKFDSDKMTYYVFKNNHLPPPQ